MRYTADGPVLRWDKISPHGAERCLYWELSLRSDGVRMRAECEKAEPPGRKYTPWLNLNNGIKWNATGKKFEWK